MSSTHNHRIDDADQRNLPDVLDFAQLDRVVTHLKTLEGTELESTASEAQRLVEKLDNRMGELEPHSTDYPRVLRRLQALCRYTRHLPDSCFIQSDITFEDRYPKHSTYLSDVYKARLENVPVAIKVVNVRLSTLAKNEKAYCDEVIFWRWLRHPNIVGLLGVSRLFDFSLVSEWMTNGTVAEYLRHNPGVDRLHLIKGMAAGLQYLHSFNFVHGDLKASNVLVDSKGNACLADFGLATMAMEHSSPGFTTSDSLRGTLRWMSPELLGATVDMSGSSLPMGETTSEDLYQLGAKLNEIYNGNVPLAALAPLLAHILHGKRATWQMFSDAMLRGSTSVVDPVNNQPLTDGPTIASDYYALAMTLLEVYTGRIPFYAIVSDTAIIGYILQGERPTRPASVDAPQLTDQVWQFMEQAWHSNPSQRLDLPSAIASLSWQPSFVWTKLIDDSRKGAYSASHSPDGRYVIFGLLKIVIICDASSGETVRTLIGHLGKVYACSYSTDGKTIASGSEDKTVRLYEPATARCIGIFTGHEGEVQSISWSPDSLHIASASEDKTVRVWSPESRLTVNVLLGHTGPVHSVAYSHDGSRIASASFDKTVRIWDAESGSVLHILESHTDSILSLAFSLQSMHCVTASLDRMVKIWDTEAGTLVTTLHDHTNKARGVAYSPDGMLIASGSNGGRVLVYNAMTGKMLHSISSHWDLVFSVTFSPDSRYLVISGSKGYECWRVNAAVGICNH